MRNKKKIKKENVFSFVEWLIYILAYTVVFALTSKLFKSFVIDETHLFIYSFFSVVIIYILNKTVKPLMVYFTLPITGLTLGLFYFVNNMVILKVVDLLLGNHVDFTDTVVLFFISVLLSFLNVLIENVIVKPFIKRVKRFE